MARPFLYCRSYGGIQFTKRTGATKKNGTGTGEPVTWDDVYKIGYGILGYDTRQLGLMTMRQFVNASLGHRLRMREVWEQSRMISYYSAFPHMKKGFKLTDILIPGDNSVEKPEQSQENKEDLYKLLEKWSK